MSEKIGQLERNVVDNAQYYRRESLERDPAPTSFSDEVLEKKICEALSLTGYEIKPMILKHVTV